ncbi:hypothetical protein [Sphingomonas sp. CFBP 13720]|uniref:hypothetical protein n=1 Tax=Sphingomonas sp. CFBP 13720 TaxID=2775302 RepID=UPI00177C7D8B|nr:hypothetical protein [Sphingomonas sp. CFBP 13720]MBD8677923.1 hypothetical protein [Sphingomonas sp. CFBP 13720]
MSFVALFVVVAAPVYLTCNLNPAKPFPVQIAADEANGRATVTFPSNGRSVIRRAVFDEKTVTILDNSAVWKIDRVTLEVRRRFDAAPASEPDETGGCEVAKPPENRAF